jgi:hypothetical protein
MQARERKLGLGLDAHSAQHLRSKRTGTFAGVSQQSGLPDARLSENNKRSASFVNSIEQLVETVDLSVAPDQPYNDRASRRGHRARIVPRIQASAEALVVPRACCAPRAHPPAAGGFSLSRRPGGSLVGRLSNQGLAQPRCPFGVRIPGNRMQSDGIRSGEKPAPTLRMGTSRTDCHAEGRGFESYQPLRRSPANHAEKRAYRRSQTERRDNERLLTFRSATSFRREQRTPVGAAACDVARGDAMLLLRRPGLEAYTK